MGRWLWCSVLILAVLAGAAGLAPAAARQPEGTLTVAVATFGNERWLPQLYPGAEDVVLKPMLENLLNRDLKSGELSPMLAERWEALEGGKAWRFYLRKGVRFHNGQEMTAEDVNSPFAQSISTILNFKQPMRSFSETNPKVAFRRAQMRRFSFTNWSAKPIDL